MPDRQDKIADLSKQIFDWLYAPERPDYTTGEVLKALARVYATCAVNGQYIYGPAAGAETALDLVRVAMATALQSQQIVGLAEASIPSPPAAQASPSVP